MLSRLASAHGLRKPNRNVALCAACLGLTRDYKAATALPQTEEIVAGTLTGELVVFNFGNKLYRAALPAPPPPPAPSGRTALLPGFSSGGLAAAVAAAGSIEPLARASYHACTVTTNGATAKRFAGRSLR